jgi:hypothetical protein
LAHLFVEVAVLDLFSLTINRCQTLSILILSILGSISSSILLLISLLAFLSFSISSLLSSICSSLLLRTEALLLSSSCLLFTVTLDLAVVLDVLILYFEELLRVFDGFVNSRVGKFGAITQIRVNLSKSLI